MSTLAIVSLEGLILGLIIAIEALFYFRDKELNKINWGDTILLCLYGLIVAASLIFFLIRQFDIFSIKFAVIAVVSYPGFVYILSPIFGIGLGISNFKERKSMS